MQMFKKHGKAISGFASSKNTNHKINILEIGCGTGYLTRLLVKTFPNAAITAVDLAPVWLKWQKD